MDGHKNQRLMLMAMSWYVVIWMAVPSWVRVSCLSTSRNRSDDYSWLVLGSGPYNHAWGRGMAWLLWVPCLPCAVWPPCVAWLPCAVWLPCMAWLPCAVWLPCMACLHCVACVACHAANWLINGIISQIYYTTNSPTSRGTYQWMIFTLLLAWNPL